MVIALPNWENIRQGSRSENTSPLRSLRPLGWRMLMYLEAMRNPMKQTVNTLAMGITAYLSMLRTDVPDVPPCAAVASVSSSDLSIMA